VILLCRKSLCQDVCKVLEGIDFGEFDNTSSVQMARIVERHIDMLGLVARYRGTDSAQCAVRVAVDKWYDSFSGDVSV
jgi:hypothetical protein